MKKFLIAIVIVAASGAAAFWVSEMQKSLPPAQTHDSFPSPTPTPSPAPTTPNPIPTPPTSSAAEINLAVPFTSQAPKMVWDEDHEDFCEEAAVLMAWAYMTNKSLSPDFADSQLYAIKDYEMTTFGYFKDTTAAETAQILIDFYKIKNVELVNNPSIETIKQYLTQGRVVIEPAAGRMLGNPNFTGAGPLYHNIVLKGYTKDGRIITNDPGTRKGANYIYSADTIINAMHDWNGGDVDHGAKVIIVVG